MTGDKNELPFQSVTGILLGDSVVIFCATMVN